MTSKQSVWEQIDRRCEGCIRFLIVALPPDLTVERENQRVAGIPPGTVSFLVRDEPVLVPDEI